MNNAQTTEQALQGIIEAITQGIPSIVLFAKLINKSTQDFSRSDMKLYIEWLAVYNMIKNALEQEHSHEDNKKL